MNTQPHPNAPHRAPQAQIGAVLKGNVIQHTCRHCGAQMDIPLVESKVVSIGGANYSMLPVASAVCCDACHAGFERREREARLKEQATNLVGMRFVLPGFGDHVPAANIPELEMANAQSWAQARAWLDNPIRSLLVVGPPDTGKTWLCRSLIFELFRRGRRVGEVAAYEIYSGAMLSISDDIRARLSRLRTVEYLYIQQLDRGTPELKHLNQLLQIMEERYARGLRTIVEMQRSADHLVQYWQSLTRDEYIGESIITQLHPVSVLPMQKPKRDDDFGMRRIAAAKRTPEP